MGSIDGLGAVGAVSVGGDVCFVGGGVVGNCH